MKQFLYEILVPTERPAGHKGKHKYFRKRFHKVWDSKIREIAGGLTILSPAKGQWLSRDGELFAEKMIPVRIMCSPESILKIVEFSANYYDQQAIFYYRVSDEVAIYHRKAD